jgi:hypothetical protein
MNFRVFAKLPCLRKFKDPMAVARFIRQALIGALALIGPLYLGFHALVWMIFPSDTAPSSDEIVSSILAPDGQHKAVIFFLAGPGFAPGSHQYIGVVATAQADASAWADGNKVFQSDCGALGETYDEMKKSVAWKSAQALQITFNPNRGCASIYELIGKQVMRVVYVVPSPD